MVVTGTRLVVGAAGAAGLGAAVVEVLAGGATVVEVVDVLAAGGNAAWAEIASGWPP
ncbi:MAG: hypothetical protein ACRDZ8_16965 [Acidimicrobiales bacterium]